MNTKKRKVAEYKFKPLPPFKTYEEEANFWDTHDATNFIDPKTIIRSKNGFSAAIDARKVLKEASMTIRLQRALQRKLELIAANKGLNVSSLARMWLVERLRAETFAA